jgi:predicted enzyme related to lactoylglutathione lyase
MRSMPSNTVNWFEIATATPEKAMAFYGKLFGWTFNTELPTYALVDCGEGAPTGGGIATAEPGTAPYAIPSVMVDDVAAICDRAAELGGSILAEPQTMPTGLTFAYVGDLDGNRIGLYSPPPAAA